jgi:1-acyl-sn-glycerol-3-phosphate acyltransferase
VTPPWWARPTAAVLFDGFGGVWPTRVHGADAVPAFGGVLFASNHLGFLDGPLLVGVAPRWVRCLVKSEMFHGVIGAVLRAAGQIPVHRDQVDRTALEAAVAVLRGGGAVGVFPEGTRGRGDVADVRLGIAWLALQAEVPVVPVACLGTRRTGESTHGLPAPRRRLDVVFGAPVSVEPPPGTSRRAALAAAGTTVQNVLAAHVREAVNLTGQTLPADLGWSAEEIRRGEHL